MVAGLALHTLDTGWLVIATGARTVTIADGAALVLVALTREMMHGAPRRQPVPTSPHLHEK